MTTTSLPLFPQRSGLTSLPKSGMPSRLALPNRMWQSDHCAVSGLGTHLKPRVTNRVVWAPTLLVRQEGEGEGEREQREVEGGRGNGMGPVAPAVSEVGPRTETGTLLDLQSQSTPDDRGHVGTPGGSQQNRLAEPSLTAEP